MLFTLTKTLRSRFVKDDTGAVTVDWVVLTAATVLLAILVMPFVIGGLENGGEAIQTDVVANVSEALGLIDEPLPGSE